MRTDVGNVHCFSSSNVTFVVPINFADKSRFNIDQNAYVGLASGGACGSSVIITIAGGTSVEMSGGNFLMAKSCTIKGSGELSSTAGQHTIAQSIEVHITIEGGALIWPMQNGVNATIAFQNGLLLKNEGQMILEPWSTTIIVNKVVEFRDNCRIQFPVIGITAQPFLSEVDAPDLSPRGKLVAVDYMKFLGGTLEGKADFIGANIMEISGNDKYIKNLAKLINGGLARWGTGNIIMDNNADLINLGKMIMEDGATFDADNLYRGIILPEGNGGDVFAPNFHSYDQDAGNIDYTEYVQKRATLVSIPPANWTVGDKKNEFCNSELVGDECTSGDSLT